MELYYILFPVGEKELEHVEDNIIQGL